MLGSGRGVARSGRPYPTVLPVTQDVQNRQDVLPDPRPALRQQKSDRRACSSHGRPVCSLLRLHQAHVPSVAKRAVPSWSET